MKAPVTVHSSEITDLVSTYPDGIRLSQLCETVAKRFGSSTLFHTGSLMGMDLDDLLASLERRNKLRIVKGVVFPCSSPTYAY